MIKPAATRMYAYVAEQIANRIADGEFSLGQRLPSERELALTYKISRPTMREAIIALEVDGLIGVRQGSGIYVLAKQPRNGRSAFLGVGPFELLEARRAMESETCALAAVRASDEDLAKIGKLLDDMRDMQDDFVGAENIDRQFHVEIARASKNSALVEAVDALWEARLSSPQHKLLSEKAHDAGIGPRLDEHVAILNGLWSRNPRQARGAMRDHLNRVLESLITATEVHESEILAQKNRIRRKMLAVDD